MRRDSPRETAEASTTGPGDDRAAVLAEVLEGLSQNQKTLPCKLFYDERGSRLFERITELDEYYLTRTEVEIMQRFGAEMAGALGPRCLLIEYGAGSSAKTRILLDNLREPAAYVPVDISGDFLLKAAEALQNDYPNVPVMPVVADFTGPFEVPAPPRPARRSVVYFPGSTIGNFEPDEATGLLRQMAQHCGSGGGVLIGVDLEKAPHLLHAAYNDADGVTAQFNLNLLRRLNRELGANFNVDRFEHQAAYDADNSRIEMYLVSRADQTVVIGGRAFNFTRGEAILTEYSHKYSLSAFQKMAAEAGLRTTHVWTDPDDLFSVQFLSRD